ncbi:2-dehydro-3-deoxygalactonokinase [Pseudoduganella namucuonensis]|uniref:2-keto-3-deoxygalactonate kinase n=1 Tax=Pseudoduganella namucuonensis TaxID=1035707 RepID=A0A1I7G9C2_9BURK|nr:2-dehydro-3-deoxygalactonokinase [Pseudoduganella namucuonensis]SFU45043.1 2-keto-3-deoxygalactonate kinase [Pseudoduganella namucuonensis]
MENRADGQADERRALALASLIGVDWGSTGLRAFLVGTDGLALAERATSRGASTLSGKEAFAEVLEQVAGDWMRARPDLKVLACGMVGSLHGWLDVPYAVCPANAPALAAGVAVTPNGEAHIVPGLLYDDGELPPDVMRGEETQILGALALRPELQGASCIVLPGTHSKWAQVRDGEVQRFATHMTGELYAVLRQHSVLGRLMESGGGFDEAAFNDGIDAARVNGHLGVGHQMFAARTLGVTGRLPAAALADYLSGLLIGHELRAGLAWRGEAGLDQAPLALVGSRELCRRYELALRRYGDVPSLALDNTAPAGLLTLARAAGLAPN